MEYMEDFVERTFGKLRVRIDRTRCIATSNCMKLSGEVFELDDEEIVAFKDDIPPVDPERLIEACRVCPVDALSVIDEHGRQLVP